MRALAFIIFCSSFALWAQDWHLNTVSPNGSAQEFIKNCQSHLKIMEQKYGQEKAKRTLSEEEFDDLVFGMSYLEYFLERAESVSFCDDVELRMRAAIGREQTEFPKQLQLVIQLAHRYCILAKSP